MILNISVRRYSYYLLIIIYKFLNESQIAISASEIIHLSYLQYSIAAGICPITWNSNHSRVGLSVAKFSPLGFAVISQFS